MGLRRYPIGRWLPFIGYGVRDGPPPRNRAVGSAVFLDRPPQSTKGGKKERQTTSQPKKECLFSI